MFPYTHICFAADILGDLNSEKVLGAVFPDTVIAGFLQHADTHGSCGDIHSQLKNVGIFEDFGDALVTHGTAPKGLDYYCDEKYLDYDKGYAFEMAKPIVDKVVRHCRLPEEMGLWKAHNFIEMAVELWLYNNSPEHHGALAAALDNQPMILALSQVLAPYFGIPVGKLAMSFPIYGEYVLLDQVTSETLAAKYNKQMIKKHNISIDVPGAASVIEEAVGLISSTFPPFIDDCRTEVTGLLQKLNSCHQTT